MQQSPLMWSVNFNFFCKNWKYVFDGRSQKACLFHIKTNSCLLQIVSCLRGPTKTFFQQIHILLRNANIGKNGPQKIFFSLGNIFELKKTLGQFESKYRLMQRNLSHQKNITFNWFLKKLGQMFKGQFNYCTYNALN
jgi:hypothetical protein